MTSGDIKPAQPQVRTLDDRTREWHRNGMRHRDDGPAVERPDGAREWFRDGRRHRDDGLAIEWADGSREWYRSGKPHRDGGPAVERPDGTGEWWLNNERCAGPTDHARRSAQRHQVKESDT